MQLPLVTVHLATVTVQEQHAVTLCLFVPRDAISNTDMRYCDQCHWLIWNKIRVSGRTCENLAARSITADMLVLFDREKPLYHSRDSIARETDAYTQPRVTRIFNFISTGLISRRTNIFFFSSLLQGQMPSRMGFK